MVRHEAINESIRGRRDGDAGEGAAEEVRVAANLLMEALNAEVSDERDVEVGG